MADMTDDEVVAYQLSKTDIAHCAKALVKRYRKVQQPWKRLGPNNSQATRDARLAAMLKEKRVLLAKLAERGVLRGHAVNVKEPSKLECGNLGDHAVKQPAKDTTSQGHAVKIPAKSKRGIRGHAVKKPAKDTTSRTAGTAEIAQSKKPADDEENDIGQLLADLSWQGYCVQKKVVPPEIAKRAAALVQTLLVAKPEVLAQKCSCQQVVLRCGVRTTDAQ